MNTSSYISFFLLLVVCGSLQKSNPASPTYKAAVVEFRPVFYKGDAVRTMNENAEKSVNFIKQAASKDADIIVFPELSLPTVRFQLRPHTDSWTTFIPDPSEGYELCTNFSIPISEALRKIACAAGKNNIYVVVNLLEKVVCLGKDNCPSDGVFYYVLNVVFDREGKIVSKARKAHLFDEYGILDTTATPEYSTFDTDFGVTFGNVVCFDIMFEEPALTQTRELNVTDIIFTSGWFSRMPFLTTIQMEAGWAYAEDVNMLAGGYNRVGDAYSGSGIYAGRQGIIAAIFPLNDHEELLIAEVPKKSKKNMATSNPQPPQKHHLTLMEEDNKHDVDNELNRTQDFQSFKWVYDKFDGFESRLITKDGSVVQRLSQNRIDCYFQANVSNLSPPVTYRLLAYVGDLITSDTTALDASICAIVQCANDSIESCGYIRNSSATFDSIAVTASYVDKGRTLMMPNTLGSNMLPLRNWAFDEYKYEERKNASIYLTKSTRNLITFGIWGRNFEMDRVNASIRRF